MPSRISRPTALVRYLNHHETLPTSAGYSLMADYQLKICVPDRSSLSSCLDSGVAWLQLHLNNSDTRPTGRVTVRETNFTFIIELHFRRLFDQRHICG